MSFVNSSVFQEILLDSDCAIFLGMLGADFPLDLEENFERIWEMHPSAFHPIKIHGRDLLTPRWQQAYGANYRYAGSMQNALPVPRILESFANWARENVDARLNGLLLNWYDGKMGHYIGAHRDDSRDLMEGSPIVTISLGEERMLRMRPWRERGFRDFLLKAGSVLLIPAKTNKAWTHEVPHFVRYKRRRISITLRAFSSPEL